MRPQIFLRRLSVVIFITALVLPMTFIAKSPVSASQNERAISVSLPSFWQDAMDIDTIIAEFEAQYGVRVEVRYQEGFNIGGGSAADASLALEDAADLASSADVIYVDNSSLSLVGTRAGYFLDLSPLVNSDTTLNPDDFYANIWESFQWNNGIWALPISANTWMVTYTPETFDNAGMAYPNGSWTLSDYLMAAEQLTEYDENGDVSVPGLSAGFGGSDLSWLFRTSLGYGFYDSNSVPEQPALEDSAIASLLDWWLELENDGVIASGFGDSFDSVPIRFGNSFIGGRGGPFGQDEVVTENVLLPGGVAGLEVQGLAVSAGTAYPDLAYELAKYLSLQPEIGNNFFGEVPARMSLQDTTTTSDDGGPGGGPNGGGPGGGRFSFNNVSETVQALIDNQLVDTLPASEIRYSDYLVLALNTMRTDGVDGLTALQTAQAQAVDDLQAAETATVVINIPLPESQQSIGSGQIELKVGVSLAGGGGVIRGGNGSLANEEVWNSLNDSFTANNSDVAYVTVEQVRGAGNNITELVGEYDCFITASNLVPDNDLSDLLNIDPFLDADPNFNRNDLVGTTLSQVQRDNLTWAYPIVISPQLLRYDANLFNQYGLSLPTEGWTIDQFIDALIMLDGAIEADAIPYSPNDPTGSYILKLIASAGGLPIDYRTDPPTINFSDPATVEAIRQILDLAKDGYIDYSQLSGQGGFGGAFFDLNALPPISGNISFGIDLSDVFDQSGTQVTLYPNGSQYGVISYDITAGYISATAQNPDACYRYLSEVAQTPQLFSGVPASRTLAADPDIASQLAPGMADLAPEIDRLMLDSNTITFPVSFGRGGLQVTYWLYQAFDNYVLNDADLETELADSEYITTDYLACTSAIDTSEGGFEVFQQYNECATLVDPDFSN